MRVIVEGRHAGNRLAAAAAGLAWRGHAVVWGGPPPPEGLPATAVPASRWRDRWIAGADVVVASAEAPVAAVWAGWQAGASALVLDLPHAAVARWTPWARLGWHSLHGLGLIDPIEGDLFRERPCGLDLDRIGLWADAAEGPRGRAAHPDVEVLERACERALARHRTRAGRPAVFLDRDGTLIEERHHLSDPDQVELLPGVPEALRMLRGAGFALVVVSNQSGVGRGYFDADQVHAVMARLRHELRRHGIEIDGVYFCPHAPEAGCSCRKPGAGLLTRAADDLGLRLGDSFLVGDKAIDLGAARAAGSRGVLVRTGHGRMEAAGLEGVDPGVVVCEDLGEAAAWILARLPAG